MPNNFAGSPRIIRLIKKVMEPGKEYTSQQIQIRLVELKNKEGRKYGYLPTRHQLGNVLGHSSEFEKVGKHTRLSVFLWALTPTEKLTQT